jgi:4-hydroxyphenylpyruvate dioxygenase
MRANGVDMLSIPANYYDDLEARTELSAERLEMLRRHDILYDRDEAGEFLHACTRSVEGGFFFEIVERKGYRGFGTVNASILLAAHAREGSA